MQPPASYGVDLPEQAAATRVLQVIAVVTALVVGLGVGGGTWATTGGVVGAAFGLLVLLVCIGVGALVLVAARRQAAGPSGARLVLDPGGLRLERTGVAPAALAWSLVQGAGVTPGPAGGRELRVRCTPGYAAQWARELAVLDPLATQRTFPRWEAHDPDSVVLLDLATVRGGDEAFLADLARRVPLG
ncbi:hypothetical protein [Nocardioides litoris]|uniref:hypothetical protein n=1 Tax=Nocardioides litoris TaxID=1926648 RepID=UPI001121CA20|nr:hypothetical protein [Nocardioides litoris]